MDFFDKYKINPYDILGIHQLSDIDTIKKAYKKKALVLHPDKTNGRTEAEFKILVLSYKYAKKNCIVSPVSSDTELRKAEREEVSYNNEMNIYNTNFEDPKERSKLFSDNQIDFETFEKNMKRIQNLPTSYTAESFYKEDILKKMKTNGKFDLDKFNAFFLKLKKEGKTSTDLVKVEKVQAVNEYDNYMKVNIYDGMVINIDDDKDTSNYRENYIVTQKDVDELMQTDLDTINNLIKEHKKDTGKISNKKIKQMMMKKSQNIAVDRTKTFSQLEKDLEIQNIMKIQHEKNEQKKIVDRYKNIYTKSLPPQFID
jgi:hypothetical protein